MAAARHPQELTDPDRLRAVREGYEAWNRGDIVAILERTHPDCELDNGGVVPGLDRISRGREGMRKMFDEWYTGPWQGTLEMELDRVFDLGDDRLLALLTFHGSGAGSGVPVTVKYAHLFEEKDGLTYRIQGFASWDHALAVAGIAQPDPADRSRSGEPRAG
jgi:ketosteroid isomerase-like protein